MIQNIVKISTRLPVEYLHSNTTNLIVFNLSPKVCTYWSNSYIVMFSNRTDPLNKLQRHIALINWSFISTLVLECSRYTYITCCRSKVWLPLKCDEQKVWLSDGYTRRLTPDKVISFGHSAKRRQCDMTVYRLPPIIWTDCYQYYSLSKVQLCAVAGQY